MITIERALLLARVPLFSQVDPETLTRIAEVTDEVVLSAGRQAFKEGEAGDALFLVVEGKVRVHVGDTELNILREAEHLGEMCLFDSELRSASATAMTDCLLLRLARPDFHEVLVSHHAVALAVMRCLAERLRRSGAAQPEEGFSGAW